VAYKDVISALSPDFWWELNGDETDSADSLDSDGGTDPSWVASIVPAVSGTHECGDYNGSSSLTQLPTSSDLIGNTTTYEKSISLWFYADTIDTNGNGRVIWGEGATQNSLSIYVYDDSGTDRLYFCVAEDSGSAIDYVSTPISVGTLYHVGATLDCNTGEMHLYLNGSLVGSKTGGLSIGSDFAAHSGGNGFGGADYSSGLINHNGDNNTGYFDGRIADIAYWGEQSVLGESDFDSIYQAGVAAVEFEQEGFRWRSDDGDEDAATWLQAQDVNLARGKNQNTRLRVLVDATGNPPSRTATLQFRKVGDPDSEWETVS